MLGELRSNGIFSWNSKRIDGRYLFITCAIIALAVSYAPASNAQIVIGPTVSLASLTDVGGDVLVGDKDFSNFSISGNFSAGQVNVTSITENGNYGIRFSGALVSSGRPE